MVRVVVGKALHRFFPVLAAQDVEVEATTVSGAIRAVDAVAPGFSDYVLDERGRLRRHVALFVNDEAVIDRDTLADPIPPGGTLHVFQALSGG